MSIFKRRKICELSVSCYLRKKPATHTVRLSDGETELACGRCASYYKWSGDSVTEGV